MFDKWRVTWIEGDHKKFKYYKADDKAINHHIKNMVKYGAFLSGAELAFRIKGYTGFVPVGGCDCLLGLTHRGEFLGKPRVYWENLIREAKKLAAVSKEESSFSTIKRELIK